MKIVFIISSLGSGGAERVVSLLANYLVNDFEIVILTFSNEDSYYNLNEKITHKKLNLLINSRNCFEKIKNFIFRIIVLKKELKRIEPNVIISFMTHTNILSIIASKLNNQKIIISERIAYDFYNSKILFFIRRIIYPFANLLITQTYKDKENYKFLKNVKVVYNPLNLKKENFQVKEKENFIFTAGRLEKQKGFEVLIKAFSKINTNWKLFIAGEGYERRNLEELIKRLNLESRVILLGNIKNIFDWYKKASIFVLSSKKEGFPNVLLEAMAFGCAVVSFDCPYGPSEIIEHMKNGILVENQNKDKLREAIELLIKDKELREKLGKEALKVRDKYSIEKIGKEWEEIINEVVNK